MGHSLCFLDVLRIVDHEEEEECLIELSCLLSPNVNQSNLTDSIEQN